MTSKIFRDDLLAGQVALVTGGGTGIGAAVARELGHLGATVCIASRKEAHIAPAAAGLSEELGREVTGLTVDIRDEGSTAELAKEIVARHGRLDILVNNGGGQFLAPAATISEKGWRAVVDTNLTGTWHMTRAAAVAWMLEHGGTVVSITMLTRRSFPGMAHSVAARAGVEAMTRTLAVEWAPMGIRLNCVAPGYIASSGMKRYPVEPGVVRRAPEGRAHEAPGDLRGGRLGGGVPGEPGVGVCHRRGRDRGRRQDPVGGLLGNTISQGAARGRDSHGALGRGLGPHFAGAVCQVYSAPPLPVPCMVAGSLPMGVSTFPDPWMALW